ncbi:MAG: hypothetical protein PUJ93_03925 [Oscillospiraceae bacterium]|nr:hypothetical protein [Oscillospiraceae bacterium]MDY5736507.1 hypothetical protein [Oscillospiraceae bacterium]
MEIEDAIRILDPETTEEALAEIEYYGGFCGRQAKIKACDEACEIAVDAMKEKRKESLRPRGRWEKWNETWDMPQAKGYLRCSECKDVYIRKLMLIEGKWSFCPNCGAKMDKEMLESEVSE